MNFSVGLNRKAFPFSSSLTSMHNPNSSSRITLMILSMFVYEFVCFCSSSCLSLTSFKAENNSLLAKDAENQYLNERLQTSKRRRSCFIIDD